MTGLLDLPPEMMGLVCEKAPGKNICTLWPDLVMKDPKQIIRILIQVHGRKRAMLRAMSCTSASIDRHELVRQLIVHIECIAGTGGKKRLAFLTAALKEAARCGHESIVRMLLMWHENAPRADCNQGEALMEAASGGHDDVVRLLLAWPGSAPPADIRKGYALARAIRCGHERVVRTLMAWPTNAPRVTHDCYANYWAPVRDPLTMAAHVGNEALVRLLMEKLPPPVGPTNAHVIDRNYMIGCALMQAGRHENVTQTLLEGLDESRVPYMGDLIGESIMRAACDHRVGTVRMLWTFWEQSQFRIGYHGYMYPHELYAKLVCQGQDWPEDYFVQRILPTYEVCKSYIASHIYY